MLTNTSNTYYHKNGKVRRVEHLAEINPSKYVLHLWLGHALELYYNDGSLRSQQTFYYGKRDTSKWRQPSLIDYYKGHNFPRRMMWYDNGKIHNLFGPAVIYYENNNALKKTKQIYYQNNNIYWLHGPAKIDYNATTLDSYFMFTYEPNKFMSFNEWIKYASYEKIAQFIKSYDFCSCDLIGNDQKIELKMKYT